MSHPVELLGAGNANLKAIRKHFPQLKLIARGDTLKVLGQTADLEKFDAFWADCVKHFNQYNSLSTKDVENMLLMDSNTPASDEGVHVWNIEIFNEAGKMNCVSRLTTAVVNLKEDEKEKNIRLVDSLLSS